MNLKPILIAIFLAFSAGALAEDAHHADTPKKPAPVTGMHEHMKLMREQMAQLRAAADPKERERLLAEHFTTMEESMSKMQGMMMGCRGM
jgi:hypothetical protein